MEAITSMEEYLQNMKALRFQMNDVEDQAAKTSVEEQTLLTSIHAMESDLESAKLKTRSLKEETESMLKEKNEICIQIVDKHKKMTSLEAESSPLSQAWYRSLINCGCSVIKKPVIWTCFPLPILELIQKEQLSLSSRNQEKRTLYTKLKEELHAKLQEKQNWFNSYSLKTWVSNVQTDDNREKAKESTSTTDCLKEFEKNPKYQVLMATLAAGRAKLAEIKESNSKLVSDNTKMEQSVKQLQCKINEFPAEIRATDMSALEEEHKALESDKAGEMEYLQTLIAKLNSLREFQM